MGQQAELAAYDASEVDGRSIANLMQVLVKAYQTFQLYPSNNPIYQRAVDGIRAAFESVWEACAELHLQIREGEVAWQGDVVLSEPTKSDCLSWALFKDGVRSLTLSPGSKRERSLSC